MKDRRCPYCQQLFWPDPYHPQQLVCNQANCQRQRRRDYHRQKIASDPVYQQVCLESPRKWREAHPDYWRKYRQDHPEQVERNRRKQRLRDEERRLAILANNNLAICQVFFNRLTLLARSLQLLANNNPLVSPLRRAYKPIHVF